MRRRKKEIGSEEIEADCVRYGVQICIRYDMPVRLRGYTTIRGSGYLVMINGQRDEQTQLNTFLHELAHIRLGHLVKDLPRDIMENQAASFAILHRLIYKIK